MLLSKPTTPAGAVAFTATLICPIGSNPDSTSISFSVDGGEVQTPPSVPVLIIKQNFCQWEGFQIGGIEVGKSVMTGIGKNDKGIITATGYDWSELANGDHYLAQWQESANAVGWAGYWQIITGTGSLQGLTGIATFKELPAEPGASVIRATVEGWYSLPAAPSVKPV